MKFTKMQGLGNDYIYVDCIHQEVEDLPSLARSLSDRHFGVGGDGLICICPSQRADFRMRMFNADGSEGEMCGNGIRCVGKFVYDKGLTDKTRLVIETLAGDKTLELTVDSGRVTHVTVDMGIPVVEPPITITVKGKDFAAIPASMGNPHSVVQVDAPAAMDLPDIGPTFENWPYFPDRTNTEFIRILARDELEMRVWERGSGETLACGTGACASVAAMASAGLLDREATVHLLGGDLHIRWDEESGHVFMTGPAVTVFDGELAD
jgi:diaminopimelate epimerase